MGKLASKASLPTGTAFAALVCGSPLLWRQVPNMSMVLYPLILVAVGWGTGRIAAKYVGTAMNAEKPYPQMPLFLAACVGLGFFAVWLAALALEIAGNIWRGNIRDSNLLFGLMSLVAGLWAAYSMRLMEKAKDLQSPLLAVGVAGLIIAVMWSGSIYELPEFSIAKHLNSSFIRTEYIVYGLFEATYWYLILPAAFAASFLFKLAMRESA